MVSQPTFTEWPGDPPFWPFWGFRPTYPGNRFFGPNPYMFYFLFWDFGGSGGPGAGAGGLGGSWGSGFGGPGGPVLGPVLGVRGVPFC